MRRTKIFLGILFTLVLSHAAFSQMPEPVKWKINAEKISDDEAEIIVKATMDPGWYIYAQNIKEGGPIPTTFTFEESDAYELVGENVETGKKTKEGNDPLFDNMFVKKFGEGAEFRQKIRITKPEGYFKGSLLFQTCDDEQCLPPTDVPFQVDLSNLKSAIYEDGIEAAFGSGSAATEVAQGDARQWLAGSVGEQPISNCTDSEEETKSHWGIFVLGLLGGLLALLTPCVFPMIPLTVSFFTKKDDSKKGKGIFEGSMYGFFIFLIYFLLGIPFLLFGKQIPPDTIYKVATSPLLNFIFFAIFLAFALSLFGYFELTLPSKWANRADSASSKTGGLFGIFFMALTLVIVSFSCTGPLLGSLMAGVMSSADGPIKLIWGLSGFGIALGLPFAIFAMFPQLMKKLPKSGGWMTTVKVFLGFVELALALKFLSNTDLVKQWGLIKYEIFIAIWILISLGLAAYMLGFIKFPHDPKKPKIGWGRWVTALLSLGLVVYLTSGLITNKPLKALSGFPPPKFYSIKKGDHHEIRAVNDIDEALALAKKENKPVLIDFTGWSCVNCRKVEENVWTNTEVADKMNNEVIVASLYVDDREELAEDKKYFSKALNKTLKTQGDIWVDFEVSSFGKISQPLYAMVSPDGKLLNAPITYKQAKSVQNYIDFIDCGVEAFKNGALAAQN